MSIGPGHSDMPVSPRLPLTRYRLGVASRLIAAGPGGHALSVCVAQGVALGLSAAGASRIDAALAATMAAFVAHAVAALWAFGCASARRAWAGIGLPAIAMAVFARAVGTGTA
jgi:hypothetical protein